MKILIVSSDYFPNVSGVATLTHEQAVGLQELSHDVCILTTTTGQVERRECPKVRVRRISQPGILLWRTLRLEHELSRVVTDWQPDFLWCTTYRGFGVPVLRVARKLGIPYGIYFHGTELLTERRFLRSRILQTVAKGARLTATNSRNSQMLLAQYYGVKADIINPGVHISPPVGPDVRDSIRRRWLANFQATVAAEDAFVFICACRVTRGKGIDKAMEAIAALPAELRARCIYVVIGDGPDWDSFRELSRELGLPNQVYFAGPLPRDEIAVCLAAADAYLQPSQPVDSFLESFGISFLEAQAAGLPCIATRFGGIAEAVKDDKTGILVEPGSGVELREALVQALRSREWYNGAACAARKWAAVNLWTSHNRKLSTLMTAPK